MTSITGLKFAGLVLALFVTALLLIYVTKTDNVSGSVIQGNEYNSTTTIAAVEPNIRLLKTGVGSLAQVTVMGAPPAATMTLYNATTSDVNKRTGNTPTSTILLADFPAGMTVGTYTFDATFTTGLLLVTGASPASPTSTITWR